MFLCKDVLFMIFSKINNSLDAFNISRVSKWWRSCFRAYVKLYPFLVDQWNLVAIEDLYRYPKCINYLNKRLAERYRHYQWNEDYAGMYLIWKEPILWLKIKEVDRYYWNVTLDGSIPKLSYKSDYRSRYNVLSIFNGISRYKNISH